LKRFCQSVKFIVQIKGTGSKADTRANIFSSLSHESLPAAKMRRQSEAPPSAGVIR